MVFAPFTRVDNHRRCVTFAAGLILKEDEEWYTWLFKRFLEVVGQEPYYIVIDQDLAMKNAIQSVFKKAKHILSMWHIMEKVSVKVGHNLFKDKNFINRLNSIVWDDYITTSKFEKQWHNIMVDFDLSSYPWFTIMYEIRKIWIPAYFRDVPMSGLLKTTSRSECTNSWFGNFKNSQSNLVDFIMHFESVMESPPHSTDKLNNQCQTSLPECRTPLYIEKHASLVYTHTVFSEVSMEIEEAYYNCSIIQINDNTHKSSYKIKDQSNGVFEVTKCKMDGSTKFSCELFEQMGLLCRHIFVILKDYEEIPTKYLAPRWMKAISFIPHTKNGHMYQFTGGIEDATTRNTLWSDFHSCIGLAQGNIEKLSHLSRLVSNEKAKLLEEHHETSVANKHSIMEIYCSSTSQLDISVLPPKQAKNKKSGSRLKS